MQGAGHGKRGPRPGGQGDQRLAVAQDPLRHLPGRAPRNEAAHRLGLGAKTEGEFGEQRQDFLADLGADCLQRLGPVNRLSVAAPFENTT